MEYYARFDYNEEVVREATCMCGAPLTPEPYGYPFLSNLVRPPLYGYTKTWLRKVS